MKTKLYRPTRYLPDRGDLDNPGWVEALNVMPYGVSGWLTLAPLASKVQLTSATIQGVHVHPSNGTNGWKIYFATDTKLYEVEPATWTETDRSGAVYAISTATGASFTSFGQHEIAALGHSSEVQIRLADAGNFANMITNAEPETSTGNWPPRAKFAAQWGSRVAIANIFNTGPASTTGNTDPNLVWVSATDNARTFGTEVSHPGDRTGYYYLYDNFGNISALAGGAEFGVVFKPTATYVANWKTGSVFQVDFFLVSSSYGCIFPNSLQWVDGDLYFFSNAGPALLSRNGVQLLGVDEVSRTLFDTSWILPDYTVNTDLSAPYLLFSAYSPATGVVSWYYRRDGDSPDFAIHYDTRSGRFSSSNHLSLVTTGASWTATVHGTAISPVLNQTPFCGGHNVYIFSKDSLGAVHIYEPDPASSTKWAHKPKFVSPFVVVDKKQDGFPNTVSIHALRPLYGLNTGEVNAPDVAVTVDSKNKTGTSSSTSLTGASEDVNGRHLFSNDPYTLYKRFTVEFGNATVDNVRALADVMAGIEIEYDPKESW